MDNDDYKDRVHLNRYPTKKTVVLCLVVFDRKITKITAFVISDKKLIAILPIICENVILGGDT